MTRCIRAAIISAGAAPLLLLLLSAPLPAQTPTPTGTPCNPALTIMDLEGMHIGTVRGEGEDYFYGWN